MIYLFLKMVGARDMSAARDTRTSTTGRHKTGPSNYFVLFALLLIPFTAHAANLTVRVATESVVNSDKLTLGDIAEVKATESEALERVRAINLGYAPNVGTVREIERERISLALSAAGFSENMVTLAAPSVAYVRRASQTVEQTVLREAVEKSLLAQMNAQGVEAKLTRLELPASIELPMGKFDVRTGTSGIKDYFTSFSVSLDLLIDNRVVKRLMANAQIEAKALVAIARRDLDAGVRLQTGDVEFQSSTITRPLSAYLRDPKRLRGVSLRSPLQRGSALTADLLVSEFVVKPGDTVRIIGQSGKLQVIVLGEARTSGRIGDRIQVKNTQSGVTLQATVTDEGEVRVIF